MKWFYFKDADGQVFKSTSAIPPPGCVVHAQRVVADGEVVTVPFYLSDGAGSGSGLPDHLRSAARRGIEMALADQEAPAQPTFDTAGRTPLSDTRCALSEALAAAPASTGELGHKVLLDMDTASTATGLHSREILRRLRDAASAYTGVHTYQAPNDAAKAACKRASEAILAFVGTKEALDSGKPFRRDAAPMSEQEAYEASVRRFARVA